MAVDATFDEVLEKLQVLRDNALETSGKQDMVLNKLAEQKQMIQDLQNSGTGGASPSQLGEISALADEVIAAVQKTEDQADTAVG